MSARSKPPGGPVGGWLKRLGAWLTELEYRVRGLRPFAFALGSTTRRVYFPGCALTAADPALTLQSYQWLRKRDPSVGLWSDCCGMPLEKFSTPAAAEQGRARTRRLLAGAGTTEIITACGNCAVQFERLGVEGLKVTSLYALMAAEPWGPRPAAALPAVVHHPCSARIDRSQQVHFDALATRLGLEREVVGDARHPLPCCLTRGPSADARRQALQGHRLITSCAHCTVTFQRDLPSRHVLQEAFGSKARWRPRGKLGRLLQYLRFARLAARRGASGSA
jgi:Cysteine-rich domain